MPELPEVETVRRQLQDRLPDRMVCEADSHPSKKFTPARSITGRRFKRIERRGKFLLMPMDNGQELVAHLGMTGSFRFVEPQETHEGTHRASKPPSIVHRRAWWQLDDGTQLEFVDIRRFGRICVVPSGQYDTLPTLANAGPEPFDPDLTAQRFKSLLDQSRRMIKTQLLSQRPIAGVGNIYADEALWLAKVNPKATRLSLGRARRLLDAIRLVLQQGIDNGGTTLRDYRSVDGKSGSNQGQLSAYGRAGQPCPRCKTLLRSASIQQRTTTWCSNCQPR